jgi:hypothetical protein
VVYSTGIYESLHFVADQENRIIIKVLKGVGSNDYYLFFRTNEQTSCANLKKGVGNLIRYL